MLTRFCNFFDAFLTEIVLASANGLSGDNLDVLASAALTQDVKLKGIRDDLSNLRKEECMQDADRQYIQSLKKGMNKYRTLAAIRKGNTKKRVEEFESM